MPDRRARGYQPDWQPRPATLELLTAVELVLGRYAAQLPLTIRQIWYAAVAAGALAGQERSYRRLVELIGMARRSGRISWLAVHDDTDTAVLPTAYDGPDAFRRARVEAVHGYRLDRQAGQEARQELWCDTPGLVPQLAGVTDPWGVPVHAAPRGLSGRRAAARRAAAGGHAALRVLVVGDRDPVALGRYAALAEDVTAFAASDAPDVRVLFERLAVTEEQIELFALPAAPLRPGERRAAAGPPATQAEALPPDALARLVRAAVSRGYDTTVLAEVLAREEADRRALLDRPGR
ncbi:hypothetical protein C6N75_27475 [Streptomyces solincola]|uniref:Uncharacterized protein n=1 Tax=Streptomyces solincola TaxID=2100817 RepID=A0A2S9PNU1_9ACTN|nr:hypothetical protein [Streptomyces solincola]PRH76090.1 hypothetical protein C6N75_27475 [Streptomyces solincola]